VIVNLSRKPATKWRLERIEERLDQLELRAKALEVETHLSVFEKTPPWSRGNSWYISPNRWAQASIREAVLVLLNHLGFEMKYKAGNRERIEFIYDPAKDETKGKKR
jgi:hypothetical protein